MKVTKTLSITVDVPTDGSLHQLTALVMQSLQQSDVQVCKTHWTEDGHALGQSPNPIVSLIFRAICKNRHKASFGCL